MPRPQPPELQIEDIQVVEGPLLELTPPPAEPPEQTHCPLCGEENTDYTPVDYAPAFVDGVFMRICWPCFEDNDEVEIDEANFCGVCQKPFRDCDLEWNDEELVLLCRSCAPKEYDLEA